MSVVAARTTGSLIIVTGRWPDCVSSRRGWIAGKCLFGKAVTGGLASTASSRVVALAASSFRARLALLLPLRIGPLQQILGAGTAQMRAAVLHHHLAIYVAGLIRDQEARQISQLTMLTGTAERIAVGPAFIAALGTELT